MQMHSSGAVLSCASRYAFALCVPWVRNLWLVERRVIMVDRTHSRWLEERCSVRGSVPRGSDAERWRDGRRGFGPSTNFHYDNVHILE